MNLVKKNFFLLLLLISNSSLLKGQETPASFVITKITNRVYIVHPGRVKRINSTSTIIVGTNFLTVIESQTDVFTATGLIKEIRQNISKLPIKYLIFSHAHSDHISGAGAFLQENPSLIIIAHEKAAEHISLHALDEQKTWGSIIKQKSEEAKKQALLMENEGQRDYWLKTAADLDTYYKNINASKIIKPNLTFSDSLNLYDNDLQIQLRYLGGGHTPGDIVVYIPHDKVLVTGDLVHDFEPLFQDADPDSWILALERIRQIDFDYFVGGHGDMHKGKDILYAWQNYMIELEDKTKDAIKNGLTLKQFQNNITIESFASLRDGYGERIQKFRTSYMEYWTGPLLDAVKDEIACLWKYYSR